MYCFTCITIKQQEKNGCFLLPSLNEGVNIQYQKPISLIKHTRVITPMYTYGITLQTSICMIYSLSSFSTGNQSPCSLYIIENCIQIIQYNCQSYNHNYKIDMSHLHTFIIKLPDSIIEILFH